MSSVDQILDSIDQNVARAPEELFALVYDELHKLATDRLRHEPSGQTLQPTALVHEVYLRLVAPYRDQNWDSRGHFFAAAAEAMRRIQVDRVRYKKRAKRGGQVQRVDVDVTQLPADMENVDLVALDEALKQLAAEDPIKAKLVVMRFFGGMTMEEASDALSISRTTGHRYWRYARAWLFRQLSSDGGE